MIQAKSKLQTCPCQGFFMTRPHLIVLCPNCHTVLEKGIISPEAINVYKTMLVSLGHAFDKESISNLLFLRNIWSQIDQGRSKKGILKYLNEHKGVGYEKTVEDLNILIISGDGVLKFSHLISAGLAGFKFCHSAPEPLYYVFPTEKGERIIDAWFSGSMQQVKQAL